MDMDSLPSLKDIFPAHILLKPDEQPFRHQQARHSQQQHQHPNAAPPTSRSHSQHIAYPTDPSYFHPSSSIPNEHRFSDANAAGAAPPFRHYSGGPVRQHIHRRGDSNGSSSTAYSSNLDGAHPARPTGTGLGTSQGHRDDIDHDHDSYYSSGLSHHHHDLDFNLYHNGGGDGGSSVGDGEGDEYGVDGRVGAGSGGGEKRKHECVKCGKKFNRPSSLKIHLNTHTGAKPFVCPFPGCGRMFNVSSNMRRHFRNHTRKAAHGSDNEDGDGGADSRLGAGFRAAGGGSGRRVGNAYPIIDPALMAAANTRECPCGGLGHGQAHEGASEMELNRSRSGSRREPPTPPYTNEPGSPMMPYGRTYEGANVQPGSGERWDGDGYHYESRRGSTEGWYPDPYAPRAYPRDSMDSGLARAVGREREQHYLHHQQQYQHHQQPSPDTPSLRHLPGAAPTSASAASVSTVTPAPLPRSSADDMDEDDSDRSNNGEDDDEYEEGDDEIDDGSEDMEEGEPAGGFSTTTYANTSDVRTAPPTGDADATRATRQRRRQRRNSPSLPTSSSLRSRPGPYALRPAFGFSAMSRSGSRSGSSAVSQSRTRPVAEEVEAVPVTMPRRNLVAVAGID